MIGSRGLLRLVAALVLAIAAPLSHALDIQTWQTDNGVKVLFVESHDLPMVDVRLTFRAGSARDGEAYGISRLANALLVEGAGKHDAATIAETFEAVGARLGHSSLRDMAWLSLRSLSEPALLNQVVDMFALVSASPSFPEDAIERDRKSMLLGLAERKKDIGSVVEDTFFTQVYRDHPYQVGSHGTDETLRAISRDDLLAFHRKYYVGRNASLAIVGDLTPAAARDLAARLTGYLQPGKAAPDLAAVESAPRAEINTIKIPFKASQTHIKQGMPVLSRKDPDYFALYVGNHIFGGSGFSSRLMQEIRENRGLVYSVYSYFIPMESNGPFEMSLQTSTAQAEEAIELLDRLLAEFIEKGPTEEELKHARSNITGGFPLKVDSNKKIVEYLALIGFYDLPLDYLDSFNQRVLAVTAADIREAFKRRVLPQRMTRVIVGEQP